MPNLFTKVKDRARAAAQPKPRTTHQVRGQVDTPFLLLTVLLVVVGLVMLLSASYPTAYYDIKHVTGGDAFYYFKRQALFAVLGLVVMYLVSKVNYQGLRGLAVLVLVLACLCMLAVKLPGLGVTAGGATRWLKYPIQWQPSELGKFGLVLYFSSRLSQRDHRTPLGFRRNHALGRFGNLLERIGFFELFTLAYLLRHRGEHRDAMSLSKSWGAMASGALDYLGHSGCRHAYAAPLSKKNLRSKPVKWVEGASWSISARARGAEKILSPCRRQSWRKIVSSPDPYRAPPPKSRLNETPALSSASLRAARRGAP